MKPSTAGELFVESLLAQDWEWLGQQLAEDVRYRGVTTSRVTEVTGRHDAVAGLKTIFEDGDVVTEIETTNSERMPPVERVSYRFRTRVPSTGEERRAEQLVFIREDGNSQIGRVDLICSGWLPLAQPVG